MELMFYSGDTVKIINYRWSLDKPAYPSSQCMGS